MERGDATLRPGDRACAQTGREMGESLCLMVLAEIDAYRGEAEKARREIPELLGVAAGVGYSGAIHRLTRALASLELSCGDAGASWRSDRAALRGRHRAGRGPRHSSRAPSESRRSSASTTFPEAERLLSLLDEHAAEIRHRAPSARRPFPGAASRRARTTIERAIEVARDRGRGARPTARGEPTRARQDAPGARHRAAPRTAQTRRPRNTRTGRREVRAARCAAAGRRRRAPSCDGSADGPDRTASSRRPSGGSSSWSSPAAGTARWRPS